MIRDQFIFLATVVVVVIFAATLFDNFLSWTLACCVVLVVVIVSFGLGWVAGWAVGRCVRAIREVE